MKVRICARCKQEIPIVLFWKSKHKISGLADYCIPCNKKINKETYLKNKEKRLEEAKIYRDANKEKYKEYFKIYKHKHKDEIREKYKPHVREYQKNKRQTDIQYKIKNALSCRIRGSIKNKNGKRSIDIVGYTIAELKQHLEKQFTKGMSWDNYGQWEIDHRIPISSFDLTNEAEIKECWALSNLQPIWKIENRLKSNKILYLV
jgi:hypothetical protein